MTTVFVDKELLLRKQGMFTCKLCQRTLPTSIEAKKIGWCKMWLSIAEDSLKEEEKVKL